MHRAQSAVDFSSLLNPEPSAERDQVPRLQSTQPSPSSSDGEMAAVGLLLPNGPLPSGATAAEPANELPRPYKCTMCEKAFHRLEHQTRHIRTHTGEKPHACGYPGCSKRFSRSDELTRHSRIHNNPNSRRGNKGQHTQHTGLTMHRLQPDMMPPPAPKTIRSAPPTAMSSPNVSPPHYAPYPFSPTPNLGPYAQTRTALASQSGPEMALLARAAGQVERDSMPSTHHYTQRSSYSYYAPSVQSARGPLPGLSAYSMSRTHSHDDQDDHYAHAYRQPKRSRPNSPNSTAPSSPTFSHNSLSPTPDHTPLATPAHSPRLRPFTHTHIELPPFRALSIQQHTPALAPLEPQPEGQQFSLNQVPPPPAPRSTGMSLSDIISRPDGAQRKLPVPKVTVHDLLCPSDNYNPSGRSSTANSVSGGDLLDRM